jgi:pimeloyl-ACP methyl ester carboxylesterase
VSISHFHIPPTDCPFKTDISFFSIRREFLAAGFVGISYPFHAKSMLVPAAVAVHSIHSFNDREGNQQGTTQGTTQTKPTLFIVAGADVVGSAGDATFAANFARKLPPPRAVVVVDDADHSWCGCYFTC